MNLKFWKKWPYWLRGGVIGAVVTLIFLAFFYSCVLNATLGAVAGCGSILVFSPIIPIVFLFDQFSNDRTPFAIIPIASVLVWFVVGALLGVLHGWSKSRKKSKDN